MLDLLKRHSVKLLALSWFLWGIYIGITWPNTEAWLRGLVCACP